MKTVLALLLLAALPAAGTSAAASIVPQDLLIYYGWPSGINGTFAVTPAAAEFAAYDLVVLGDGLEKTTHPDHANTVAIMAAARAQAGTRFFGYVDLGVSTQNLPEAEIRLRIDEWLAAGADGIFLDDYGYDFGVTRARQNLAVDHAHLRGLPVVANAWVPADVFGDAVDPVANPAGTPTSVGAGDYYLAESFVLSGGAWQDTAFWWAKAAALDAYRAELGFDVLAVTTPDGAGTFDQAAFAFVWHAALLWGHAAVGWGEPSFAAATGSAPWRPRPATAPGSAFASAPDRAGEVALRYTDTGRLRLDGATHTAAFLPGATAVPDGRDGPWAAAPRAVPNPFNPLTRITFALERPARLRIAVYALDGARVAVPADGRVFAAGRHEVPFDARHLASGIYLCRLEGDGAPRTLRLALVR